MDFQESFGGFSVAGGVTAGVQKLESCRTAETYTLESRPACLERRLTPLQNSLVILHFNILLPNQILDF